MHMNNNSGEFQFQKSALAEWVKAFLVVGVIFLLFRYFQSAGWFGNIGGIGGVNSGLSLGVSFLIGVAASLSSCLAVVGGMVIAFSEKHQSANGKSFFRGVFLPNLKFHVGRIAAFFVLGGILGLVGGSLNLSGNFISTYTILVAVVMGWLGLSILGIVPPISSLGLRPPKFISRFWGQLEDSERRAAPWLLGGITFFLPCGFTQSMQIVSLASGSFWSGASIMSAFALGTTPALFALGAAASWARAEKMTYVSKAAGIVVILFAAYTLNSGLAIRPVSSSTPQNLSLPPLRPDIRRDTSPRAGEAVQKIDMKITSRGFEPSVFKVKNGIPVRFAVNGDGATGCTNKIVIPDLGIEKEIKKGENIVEFTPKKVGPIAYSCWMGMVRGKIIVE